MLAALPVLSACRKDHELDCFKSNGKVTVQHRALEPFHTLRVFDNLEVTVVQDDSTYATVRTGRNIQEDIELEVRAGTLRIGNTSRCNWVRSYDVPRQVTVHTPSLTGGVFHIGERTVRTAGTFHQDTLFLHVARAGDLEFDVDCTYLWVDLYELGDMRLSGRTEELQAIVGDLGSLYARPLSTQRSYVRLNSDGDGNAHVTATDFLGANIGGPGTVYYAGPPRTKDIRITGRGRAVAQ
ncbi:head GIN domain-containing protein [Hymenobacter sp. B81]|uniref:head GIN domain-containing protein n=1 Tax=Hymenobacter sp. B81 TaxID=3344878 RepID=UPI0037DCB5AF